MKENQNYFYTLSNDTIFKNAFDTEESLKRLLEESLNLKVYKILSNNIELPVEHIKERRKYLDLILDTNEGIINVELNHIYKNEIPNRNFLYFCKLISSSVKRTKSYFNIKKHIQLNITWNLKEYFNFDITNRKIIKCYIKEDETNNKVHDDIFEIVHINMDYYKNVWYHGDIEKENPFLMLLAADAEDKMEKISKGDKIMEELSKKVNKLNQDPEIIDVIIENEDEIINNTLYEKGISEGISQGISQGIEQNKIENAKKMLKEKLDIDLISKITGLSKDEIKKL